MKCLVIAWLTALPAINALSWPEFSHDELVDGAAKLTEQPLQEKPTSSYFTAFGTVHPPQIFKPTAGLDALAPFCNLSPTAPTSVTQSQQNQQNGKPARAIPTNKWWGNLISVDTKSASVANPAWANPYALKLPADPEDSFGLQTCYSYTHRKKADEVDGAIKYYLHEYHNDLTLSAAEFTSKPNYEVTDWNELSVHLQICAPSDQKKCMHADLVQGMAFVTASYVDLTPKFTSEYEIVNFDDAGNGKYVVELENKQTWVLYADCKNGETFTLGSDKQSVDGPPNYSGTVRAAVLPSEADSTVYDEFSGCIVKSGDVSMHSRTSYSLDWTVEGQTCSSAGLLHFALPHHMDSSIDAEPDSKISLFSTMRGEMAALVARSSGNTASWKLSEPEFELDVGFYPPRKPSAEIVQSTNLKELLKEDIECEWEASGEDESFYFDGKAMQKYASLCLMADDEAVVGQDKSLLETCLTKLKEKFDPFLKGKRQNKLAYDTTYGGIVTDQVFTAGDVGVDFGNGVYNDHHYHYGYWIAAAAILKKLDPSYDSMAELDEVITTLLRDVVNPSSEDIYFPRFRHFSWFLGHSYSHGVTPLADGKDEESTSEDVNFFYGMMLWGMATGNKNIQDLASLMLRIDARAIQTYFLMTSDNKVHPPEFAKNKVTGIFFDNKADYASWFSAEKYCIHGIQMLPASPITEFVRTKQFVQEEWDEVLSKEEDVISNNLENTWLSILYVNKASVDVQDAISKLTTVALDDGLTRSWALYFAATRPGNGEGAQVQKPTSTPTDTPTVTPMVTPSVSSVVTTTKTPVTGTTLTPTVGPTDYSSSTSSTSSQVGMDLEPSTTPSSVPNQTEPEPSATPSSIPTQTKPASEPSATPNTGVTQTEPEPIPEQNAPTYSCDLAEGDLMRGVASVDDPSCAAGGLGCFFGKCRLCQEEKTEFSAHLLPCNELK